MGACSDEVTHGTQLPVMAEAWRTALSVRLRGLAGYLLPLTRKHDYVALAVGPLQALSPGTPHRCIKADDDDPQVPRDRVDAKTDVRPFEGGGGVQTEVQGRKSGAFHRGRANTSQSDLASCPRMLT